MVKLTEAQLQALVAGVFSFVESKEGPGLKLATEIVANAVNSELPALYAWLLASGIVTP